MNDNYQQIPYDFAEDDRWSLMTEIEKTRELVSYQLMQTKEWRDWKALLRTRDSGVELKTIADAWKAVTETLLWQVLEGSN
jgi:hypothetical protein